MKKITRKFILGIGLIIVSSCTQSNKHICPTTKQNNTIVDTCYSSTFNEIDYNKSDTFNYKWIEIIHKDTMHYIKGIPHPIMLNKNYINCLDGDCCGTGELGC